MPIAYMVPMTALLFIGVFGQTAPGKVSNEYPGVLYDDKPLSQKYSPRKDVRLECWDASPLYWIVSVKHPNHRKCLPDPEDWHNAGGTIKFSPSERYLFYCYPNTYESNRAFLFKRFGEVDYRPIIDLGHAWGSFLQRHPRFPIRDADYIYFLGWQNKDRLRVKFVNRFRGRDTVKYTTYVTYDIPHRWFLNWKIIKSDYY